jgi:hypothetical protein
MVNLGRLFSEAPNRLVHLRRLACKAAKPISAVVVLATVAGSASAAGYNLLVSTSANRSGAKVLSGQSYTGNIYVFAGPNSGVSKVNFYLDDPRMSGSPYRQERIAPYDLAGSDSVTIARPFDTNKLARGTHSITAQVILTTGERKVLQGAFNVGTATQTSTLTSGTGSVRFAWIPPSSRSDGSAFALSQLLGFHIYYGADQNSLRLVKKIQDPTATNFTMTGLPSGKHFFAITALDTAGLESARSAVLARSVP